MFGDCVAMMDECEDVSMAFSPDFRPNYRLDSIKLLSVIQDSNSSMSFSPEPTTSPLQNISLNTSSIGFCEGETPKRCLDLSNLSNGGESWTSPEIVHRGPCLGSPGLTDAQPGESRQAVGRAQPLLPEILCSSPMLVTSEPQSLAQNRMDFGSLGHNKENEGDGFKKPICPAPKIMLIPFQEHKLCETMSSSVSSLFGFEMEEISQVTSTDSQCLDHSMSDNNTSLLVEQTRNDSKRDSNMNVAMSSSMAALFTGELMTQGMDTSTVPVRRGRPGLFRSPSLPERLHRPFLKRLERSQETDTPVKTKRQRGFEFPPEHNEQKRKDDQLMRGVMASCKDNMTNVLEEESNPVDLIGNHSNVYALPTVLGKHEEMKYIIPETVAKVLHGEYDHLLGEVYIIDCRYPYEFEGGHIKGALNHHRADDAIEFFLKKPIISKSKDKRLVIIFHCEFSSERAPKMCRLVREEDRSMNNYPNLYYPELYILKGGYKAFFSQFSNYCDPPTYCPMDHVDFQEEMLKLRKKSKSWAGERRRRELISRLTKM